MKLDGLYVICGVVTKGELSVLCDMICSVAGMSRYFLEKEQDNFFFEKKKQYFPRKFVIIKKIEASRR
jgi:hypothetical protein